MRRFYIGIAAVFAVAICLAGGLRAQQESTPGSPVITYPFNTGIGGTNHATLTLPLTGNLALAANQFRRGCSIQYKGTNTVNIATNSSMNDALVLPPATTNNYPFFTCAEFGIVIGDPLYITGTSADTVVLWWQ